MYKQMIVLFDTYNRGIEVFVMHVIKTGGSTMMNSNNTNREDIIAECLQIIK
jgi:hypothetical protein